MPWSKRRPLLPCKDLHCVPGLRVQRDVPLAKFTSFRIGGQAKCFLVPGDLSSLENTLDYLYRKEIPFYVLGQGTNLLVSDKGVETVLSLKELNRVDYAMDSHSRCVTLTADAGVKIRRLLAWSVKSGFGGLEDLAGIPASLGGAVRMNAGTRHGAINEVITEVRLSGPGGSRWIPASSLQADYRDIRLPQRILISGARLHLSPKSRKNLVRRVKDIMAARTRSQPLGMASAGCIFKNPKDDSAGRLIDTCGLKGRSIGGAQISSKHANFIVNTGGARAVDVVSLMLMARDQVRAIADVELTPEIAMWGEDVQEIFN